MKAHIKNVILGVSTLAFLHSNFATAATTAPATLAVGDSIVTNRPTRVWVTPPTAGELAGLQTPNAKGCIVDGPARTFDAVWWKVDFITQNDGWVMERDLRKDGVMKPNVKPRPAPPISDHVLTISPFTPASGSVVSSPQIIVQGRIAHDVYAPSMISATLNGKAISLNESGGFAVKMNLIPGKNDLRVRATTPNPRQQVTNISTYIDGSMIYGSDATRANALRTFQGGLLKTSEGNLLPLNTNLLANANDAHLFPDAALFLAGDVRANENLELTSIHTLFLREHNQIATALAAINPRWNDEQLYQVTRKIVIAEVQVVTYNEFLPALLGNEAMRPYAGYSPHINAGLATEFSTAGFRIGHTLINDDIEFFDNDAEEIREGLPLAFAFFNPGPLHETGPDPLLKYLATDNAQEVDTQLVSGLRDFLFGPPGAGGLDLAALNIQRGRDHGLADYNTVRKAYKLPAVMSVFEITSDPILQQKLLALYPDINTLDLWIAGLAEDHLSGSSVGPTFQRIIADQFERTRAGDRFWYQRSFVGPQLQAIEATRLADIIRRNTTITKIQDNVFFFDADTTLVGLTEKIGNLPPALLDIRGMNMMPAPLDGKGNNLLHLTWGAAGSNLLRLSTDAYGDRISTPSGSNRPGARVISNSVAVLSTEQSNQRSMSSWVYGWGQFIDHDLGLTTTGSEAFDIPVPTGDPSFDPTSSGTEVMPFSRSNYDSTTGDANATTAEKLQSVILRAKTTK